MEDTLREFFHSYRLCLQVLILVLMEDTLRDKYNKVTDYNICLNPCSNGRYSQRGKEVTVEGFFKVLILVLMEDTLREAKK